MQCDFQNVTVIFLRNMGLSTAVFYISLINTLFVSYLVVHTNPNL